MMKKKLLQTACAAVAFCLTTHALAATDTSGIENAAKSLPAEFQADVLLRIIDQQQAEQGSSWPVDRAATVAMLENIYSLGFNMTDQLPYRPVAAASPNQIMAWSGTPLDRVSLQMAAATSMAMLDVNRAMAMFARDEKLKASAARCGEAALQDYSPVYRVASILLGLQTTPDPKFVEERFDRARSATALAPIFEMAARVSFNAAQYGDIVRWSSDALNRISGDDQAFTVTLPEVASAVAEFRAVLTEAGVDQSQLKTAYAAYLSKNLNGPRCAENLTGARLDTQNAVVASLRSDLNLNVAETPPSDESAMAETSLSSLAIQANDTALAITGDETGAGALSGNALTQQIVSLLNAVDTAGTQQEDATFSVYEARLSALLAYLAVAPVSADRTRAKQTVIALVSDAPVYRQSHAQWLDGAKRLLCSMMFWPDATTELNALVTGSTNSVLGTYARLAQFNMLQQPSTLSK